MTTGGAALAQRGTAGSGDTGFGRRAVQAALAGALLLIALSMSLAGARSGAAADAILASDSFTRARPSTWGTADVGGAYAIGGGTGTFAVDGQHGTMALAKAGANLFAALPVATRDVDITVRIAVDKVPVGGSIYAYAIGRRNGLDEYRSKVMFKPDRSLAVGASIVVNGAETAVGGPPQTIAGMTYSAGGFVWLHTTMSGISPTVVRVKAWADGTAEPSAWQLTASSSSTAIQNPGGAGVRAYMGAGVSNLPLTVSFDDLAVAQVSDATASPTPSAAPTPTDPPTPAATDAPTPALTDPPTPAASDLPT